MTTQPVVRTITEPDDLRALHAGLLVPSFPPDELVSAEWLVRATADGDVRVIGAYDPSGAVAVAVTERLTPAASVLLAYLATRSDQRGTGVGSAIYTRALDDVRTLDRPPLILAEVERPDRHHASAEHGDPTARLRFYARLGARALDLPYFQPPVGAGAEPVHGLLLLALWAEPTLLTHDGTALADARPLADAIDAILGDDDGAPAAALRAAASLPAVGLFPVTDYARIQASAPTG